MSRNPFGRIGMQTRPAHRSTRITQAISRPTKRPMVTRLRRHCPKSLRPDKRPAFGARSPVSCPLLPSLASALPWPGTCPLPLRWCLPPAGRGRTPALAHSRTRLELVHRSNRVTDDCLFMTRPIPRVHVTTPRRPRRPHRPHRPCRPHQGATPEAEEPRVHPSPSLLSGRRLLPPPFSLPNLTASTRPLPARLFIIRHPPKSIPHPFAYTHKHPHTPHTLLRSLTHATSHLRITHTPPSPHRLCSLRHRNHSCRWSSLPNN